MISTESNVFPFSNLSELETRYRVYEIRGLKQNADYYKNRQHIVHRLSSQLKHPITVIKRDEKPYLIVSADAPEPPEQFRIVRGMAYFKPTEEILILDYTLRTPENDQICLRFLHFMVQSALFNNAQLWQPSSGRAFFEKTPSETLDSISLFRGFTVRPIITQSKQIGLCVDVQHKFVSPESLPAYMTEQTFQRYKSKRCVYHFGHQWYEIQLSELSDLNAVEEMIPDRNKGLIPLHEYIIDHSRKPIPEDLLSVPQDAAVVHYFDNQGNDRTAIAALCYLVYDNTDPEIQKHHSHTILKPHIRRSLIHQLLNKYLRRVKFGDITLQISHEPEKIDDATFTLPDCRFGQGYQLSVRESEGKNSVTLQELGRKRLDLLSQPEVGLYVQERFDRQYLLLPQTVGDSFGSKFIRELKQTVDRLYPSGGGYKPEIVYYPDRGFRTYIEQGKAILATVEAKQLKPGYGVIMLHPTPTPPRQQDPLEALVVRELKQYDLYVAVMHSTVGKECYEQKYGENGQPFYTIRSHKKGKWRGYLRAVALNKVLLTNQRWPFVLDTPLHADVIIGIDVKYHTAGYIVINKAGDRIWLPTAITSKQKEQLSTEQVKACLIGILRAEVERTEAILQHIVIHRDGRIYDCEIEGAKQALVALKSQGDLPEETYLTILEISKSAPASLRLFEVENDDNNLSPFVQNPIIGRYRFVDNDGYLCSTGRPFIKDGTVNPLHVKYVEGALPFLACLEDLYYLTSLPWTKPDSCIRHPITTKLNDRRLYEDASKYDEDALRFDSSDEIESELQSDEIAVTQQTNQEVKV